MKNLPIMLPPIHCSLYMLREGDSIILSYAVQILVRYELLDCRRRPGGVYENVFSKYVHPVVGDRLSIRIKSHANEIREMK